MSTQAYQRLISMIGGIDARAVASPAPVAALVRGLDQVADARLLPARSATDIRIGVTAKLAAIELDPAAKALNTAAALAGAGAGPKSIALALQMAKKRLLSACSLATELPADLEVEVGNAETAAPAPAPASAPGGRPAMAILRNIATYHREHERYYSWYKTQEAADMFREANRLKAVATVWLDEAPLPVTPAAFDDPRYAAAGCEDLNALRAIGSIGVLFMEGEQEPAEIRGLKGKLGGLAPAWQSTGKWLADKMESAWVRESVVLRDEWIAAAEPRFGTIVTNWRGSRQMELAGRCANLALQMLQSLDLRPQVVRADRRGSGRRLLDAAWVLDYTAQVTGRSALDLSENEMRWTEYLDFMARIPEAAE